VDLRVGGIEDAPYDDDFFDVVTCNASMSYWKNPVSCFDQIYRVLKPGGCAVLFEPQKDIDLEQVVETIRANLADESWLRRWAAVSLNKFGLRWGRTLGLKLYSLDELEGMTRQSQFGDCVSIERITLQNLPIFARIALTRPGEADRCS
jgi:ubiquinone/menaquinone biosynthesis C-methylase UbiE